MKKNYIEISGNVNAGQTIVFGHGFGTDHTVWRSVLPAFENDYRILAFDSVGMGKSDPKAYSKTKYSRLNSYADDVIEICQEHGLKDAIYIGHSVSGMTGLLASTKAPDFFSKHIFINASPRYLNDTDYVGGFEQADLDSLYHAMETNYYAWASGFAPVFMDNPERPQLAERFAATLSAIRPDIALGISKVIFESDHRKDLAGFEKETLLIQSDKDLAVPVEVGNYLNKNLKKSKLEIIKSRGHFPHVSTPEEVIKAIKAYLAEN